MVCRGIDLFDQFMAQIQPDEETRAYLLSVIANTISGYRDGEYTYILHGPTGANGKSVLMALLQNMLGDYCSWYDTDSVFQRNVRQAEEDAKDLENRRLVIGMTLRDNATINSELFKQYFIDDSYTIREKYKPAYTVKSTHTLFLPVNQIPNFGSDPEVRRHLVVIPFTECFVDNPDPRNPHEHAKDDTILEQLIEHRDEIFTYLVYLAEYLQKKRKQNMRIEIPATVKEYTSRMLDKNKRI